MTHKLKKLLYFNVLMATIGVSLAAYAQDSQADTPETSAAPAPESILPGAVRSPSVPATPAAPITDAVTNPSVTIEHSGEAAVLPLGAEPAAAPIMADVGSGGPLPVGFGTGTDSWAGSRGALATELMRHLEAPLASRYGHIALRRLLMTKASLPAGADPLKFVAARAHLLLRMGEAEAAKMVIETVPVSVYDRGLFTVAAQVHLAAIDLAATCPLAQRAIVFSPDSQWPLLSAICSALQGDDSGAALGLDIAQQGGKVNKYDLSIAQQAVTAVAGGGRAGLAPWPVGGLFTSYRVGATYASGQSFPDQALISAPIAVQSWLARSAFVDAETRYKLGWTAAALGTMSAEEFISGWAARGAGLDPRVLAYRPEGLLQKAATATTTGARYNAMRQLWAMGKNERSRMAMWLITSDAAARFPLLPSQTAIAPDLLRSMLMGGRLKDARRWAPIVLASEGDALNKAWPLLYFTDSQVIRPIPKLIEAWLDAQSGTGQNSDIINRRKQMLIASLEGLAPALLTGASISRSSRPDDVSAGSLFIKLADAARRHAKGEVLLLGSLAMGHNWSDVSPGVLKAVLSAYHAVGLDSDARLIAAEAIIMAGG